MTDEQRHRNMAAIHGKDTKPEMVVRRFLWHHGFRYIVNVKWLPGKPDVVLRGKYKVCLFVNGCFWHGHKGCYRLPKTNVEFWTKKVKRNQERDEEVRERLKNMGWHCVTMWECELKPAVREENLNKLVKTLEMLKKGPVIKRGYCEGEEESNGYAAESEEYYE